ncbi:hypothetical protein MYX07_01230 [Patescibacteria group bacterium AH-259-L07]|nr:hypothetical protein [Patescibacteria group bacterium AH-259-L07]
METLENILRRNYLLQQKLLGWKYGKSIKIKNGIITIQLLLMTLETTLKTLKIDTTLCLKK